MVARHLAAKRAAGHFGDSNPALHGELPAPGDFPDRGNGTGKPTAPGKIARRNAARRVIWQLKRTERTSSPDGRLHPTPGNTKPRFWAGLLTRRHPLPAPSRADFVAQWRVAGIVRPTAAGAVPEWPHVQCAESPASRFTLRRGRGPRHPKRLPFYVRENRLASRCWIIDAGLVDRRGHPFRSSSVTRATRNALPRGGILADYPPPQQGGTDTI